MRSIRFSKQKYFHSLKTKGVSNFKTAFNLASYTVYWMSRQDNATFRKNHSAQKLSATFIYLIFLTNVLKIIKDLVKRHRFCMLCAPFILLVWAIFIIYSIFLNLSNDKNLELDLIVLSLAEK